VSGAVISGSTGAAIALPGDWTDLDLDPATRHASISRAVRRTVRRDPALAAYRTRLIALLDRLVRRASDAGAFFCSSLVINADDDGEPLAANLLMQRVDDGHPDDGDRCGDPCGGREICAGIAAAASCDPDWEDADVDVVQLPSIGPAVRLGVIAGGVCVQYIVPVPHRTTKLVVTFTSPSARYGTALVELFDAMAHTLRLEYCEWPQPKG
jgi:hypothetical protein